MAVMNIININDTSNKLFYIGGVVRDELLGRKSLDIDITYVGNAIEYCARFGKIIRENPDSVSYTHLTLPTKLEV